MSYGKIISGGKQMSKGLTKGINDKLATFSAGHERSDKIATAVRNTFTSRHLSEQHVQNVNGGKFEKPKSPKNV